MYLPYFYGCMTIFPWKLIFAVVFVDKLAKKTARKTVRKMQDEPTLGSLLLNTGSDDSEILIYTLAWANIATSHDHTPKR